MENKTLKSKYIFLISLFLCFLSIRNVIAESTNHSNASEDKTVKHLTAKTTFILSSDSDFYPPELMHKGINGGLVLTGYITKSGDLMNLQIKETSKSSELDLAAIKFITHYYVRTERSADAVVDMPIVFSRDYSIDVLTTNPCGEIVKDIIYYKKTYPEKKITDMRYLQALAGTLMMYNIQNKKHPEKISFADAVESAFTQCATDGAQSFFALTYHLLYGSPVK